ncbi:amidohydrolase family protein [Porticoccus sp. W117]|uniref:N-acyl-D-amino-acid deacylase family protein n=1 Tax=Porticoccus sp. W117 TaxID=3054777 RepID=UPI00259831AD|nr:amidohydrolase family protein [Porticoccus sp. W117]MDM3871126.1 amidohydrolase family protein [Porticoccus sp. W117]
MKLKAAKLKAACAALCTTLLALCACTPEKQSEALNLDTLIVNGNVYAGKNQPASQVAIGVKGDRIVFVGDPEGQNLVAARTIDAAGKVVAPGLIDPHTHSLSDFTDLRDNGKNANLNYLTQGVTTVFNGNDGGGPIKTGDLIRSLNKRGLGTNTALFIGHGAVRRHVMGEENRHPTDAELDAMKALVAEAMEQGALGLSTGLFYVPGTFSDTAEVIELAKVAAEYGGIYESHIRDESSYNIGVVAAVQELLDIGKGANIPVHIAHIKALGVDVWGESAAIVDLVEKAQANGQVVTADQYPWNASSTRLHNAAVPSEVRAGGYEQYSKRLQDPELLPEIRAGIAENIRRRGGPESFLMVQGEVPEIIGKTLKELSEEQGKDPVTVVIENVLKGSVGIASFNMNEEDIGHFMVQPWVMTSSDGTDGHPRKYASFPRKYQNYVKDKGIISEQEFIYRSSGMVADTFKIADRGYLQEGYFADIVIIDTDNFRPVADFKNWNKLSEGVVYALVNGEVAIDNGKYTGTLAGKALRRAD